VPAAQPAAFEGAGFARVAEAAMPRVEKMQSLTVPKATPRVVTLSTM
jgi:hypothetical protein